MQVSEQTIIELVKGQAATAQAVSDLKGSLERSIPFLVKQDEENAAAIRSVERKVWYFGGVGSAVGFLLSHLGSGYFKFGGK